MHVWVRRNNGRENRLGRGKEVQGTQGLRRMRVERGVRQGSKRESDRCEEKGENKSDNSPPREKDPN